MLKIHYSCCMHLQQLCQLDVCEWVWSCISYLCAQPRSWSAARSGVKRERHVVLNERNLLGPSGRAHANQLEDPNGFLGHQKVTVVCLLLKMESLIQLLSSGWVSTSPQLFYQTSVFNPLTTCREKLRPNTQERPKAYNEAEEDNFEHFPD